VQHAHRRPPTKRLVGLAAYSPTTRSVRAALAVLEPLYRGENALEPERVSEKLHQHTFWLGRGGSITHTISGIDIALWTCSARPPPAGGRCSEGRCRERVQPYASLLMEEPAKLRDHLLAVKAQGFRAFKIGWGPFGGAMPRWMKPSPRRARGGRHGRAPDGHARSDAYWTHGVQWALNTARGNARRLRRALRRPKGPHPNFEGAKALRLHASRWSRNFAGSSMSNDAYGCTPLAAAPSEQAAHRLAGGLAEQVPQRNIDA